MKKFGFGKKDKSDKSSNSEDDPNRSRLFGKSKSKGDTTAPASSNPYAINASTASSDPYAHQSQSYNQQSSGYGGLAPGSSAKGSSAFDSRSNSMMSSSTQPPPYTNSNGNGYNPSSARQRNDKSPNPPGSYSGGQGYGNTGYNFQSGYGADRYGGGDSASITSSIPSSTRPGGYGGYGGMGRSESQETLDTQSGKDALFGGAKQRFEQRAAQGLPPEEDPAFSSSNGAGAGAGGYGGGGAGTMDMGYGAYQDRQLTAEEEEEEDVQATKQQIRAIKQQDVASTRNALRIAEQAEATGRETLERLGAQGERIHNTEKNLDLASNQNRLAEEKARELKHLNRSMWNPGVSGNPFSSSRRNREREEQIISQHHYERNEREATRKAAYSSSARKEEQGRGLRDGPVGPAKRNVGERSKYQFEADSEDEGMEDEIDSNLDALTGAAKRLNMLGRAMGEEVDSQNVHIGRIAGKADSVDDQIVLNRGRLERIERRG